MLCPGLAGLGANGWASALLRASLGSCGQFLPRGLILHTSSKLGRAVLVAIYGKCAPGGLFGQIFGRACKAVLVAIYGKCAPGGLLGQILQGLQSRSCRYLR